MKLRRFSQLGWHGCMDLVAAAAGHHVVRVELGEPPKKAEGVTGLDLWTVDGVNYVGPQGGAHLHSSRAGGKTERGRRWGMASDVFMPGAEGEVLRIHRNERTGDVSVTTVEDEPATEPCEICKGMFPPEKLDCEPYGRICDPCYWSLHNS